MDAHKAGVVVFSTDGQDFVGPHVEMTVDIKGHEVGQLQGDCWHWSWRSLGHLAKKLDGYTSLQATELRKPFWKLYLRRPVEYPILLFRYLFLKRHITGGIYGIAAAHTLAKGRAARIGKIIKAQKRTSDPESGQPDPG